MTADPSCPPAPSHENSHRLFLELLTVNPGESTFRLAHHFFSFTPAITRMIPAAPERNEYRGPDASKTQQQHRSRTCKLRSTESTPRQHQDSNPRRSRMEPCRAVSNDPCPDAHNTGREQRSDHNCIPARLRRTDTARPHKARDRAYHMASDRQIPTSSARRPRG